MAGCEILSMNGKRSQMTPKFWHTLGVAQLILIHNVSYQEPTNHMAFSSQECEVIDNEIEELLAKRAIQVSEHENGEVILPILLRYKKDGSPRPIINLTNLNSHVVYSHLKMEILEHALDLISEGYWLA